MNLSVDLCGVKLGNPTILASGILGVSRDSLARVASRGAGAVTTKSISRESRMGHNNPCVVTYEGGMLNAMGYPNPGAEAAREEFATVDELPVPVIASAVGSEPEEFAAVAEILDTMPFAAIEIPVSCPHTPGFGLMAGHASTDSIREITSLVREKTKLPLLVKLPAGGPEIVDLARAARDGGADAITAVNTAGPGMVINIEAARPVLGFKVGGVSGPALRPIAVRCVYDIYEAIDVPIIGVGGIMTGKDAIEMIMAGATAVGIGTAVYYRGIGVFGQVSQEIESWMEDHGHEDITEIVGAAHGEERAAKDR
jgi:dihydroorotate dehydrogenase (NAD+) catalytic subunit